MGPVQVLFEKLTLHFRYKKNGFVTKAQLSLEIKYLTPQAWKSESH